MGNVPDPRGGLPGNEGASWRPDSGTGSFIDYRWEENRPALDHATLICEQWAWLVCHRLIRRRSPAPQWWLNLKANPNANVLIKSAKIAVRARETYGEERDRLCLEFVSMYSGYMGYEQRTNRRFPIAVLEPLDGEVH